MTAPPWYVQRLLWSNYYQISFFTFKSLSHENWDPSLFSAFRHPLMHLVGQSRNYAIKIMRCDWRFIKCRYRMACINTYNFQCFCVAYTYSTTATEMSKTANTSPVCLKIAKWDITIFVSESGSHQLKLYSLDS